MNDQNHLLGQYAGYFSRLVAFIIDVFILAIIAFSGSLIITSLFTFVGVDLSTCEAAVVSNRANEFQALACSVGSWALLVFNLGLMPVYIIFFWALAGQTLGKATMGVRIVRTNGKRMGFTPAIIRLLGYTLSILSLGLGFLWILIDDRRQGWHDKLARTVVLYSWKAQMDERFLWRVVAWIKRKRPDQAIPSRPIDITPAIRSYRVVVLNLEKDQEAEQALSLLTNIDRDDPDSVLSVMLVSKTKTGLLDLHDVSSGYTSHKVTPVEKEAVNARMKDVLAELRARHSTVVAVIDRRQIQRLTSTLPEIELAIYRLDITPELPSEEAGESQEAEKNPEPAA
jgi:uncharacterized RDD family membrane protein YckC